MTATPGSALLPSPNTTRATPERAARVAYQTVGVYHTDHFLSNGTSRHPTLMSVGPAPKSTESGAAVTAETSDDMNPPDHEKPVLLGVGKEPVQSRCAVKADLGAPDFPLHSAECHTPPSGSEMEKLTATLLNGGSVPSNLLTKMDKRGSKPPQEKAHA